MEVNQEVKSCYQPRPVEPSVGRALAVLVAVCAVLYCGWQLPRWYWTGTGNRAGMRELRNVLEYVVLAAPVWSNYLVFGWATRPMWRATDDYARVLLLGCLLFHLAWLLVGLLAVLYSIADTPHFG